MFDARLAPLATRLLAPAAHWLDRRGLSADQVTLTGFGIGLLAVPLLAAGQFGWALAAILANRVADGLDGTLARLRGPTSRGAFLDIALDFAFYALVVLGFALADPERNALPAAVLLTAFIGTGSSFLAFSVIAERKGLVSTDFTGKGIFYLGGLAEGAETIAFFLLAGLWPQAFPWLAYGFAFACLLTTLSRWREGYRHF
ncbi:MAG: CDP-alcohol phosphatidyltransferase family protein [Methylobacterium sp.]|nr:CDP-alcohol phosphatidyltransferase family protein [Methylobacterium sp.]